MSSRQRILDELFQHWNGPMLKQLRQEYLEWLDKQDELDLVLSYYEKWQDESVTLPPRAAELRECTWLWHLNPNRFPKHRRHV